MARTRRVAEVRRTTRTSPRRDSGAYPSRPDPELDAAVDRVRQHMASAARSSWAACEELRCIHDEALWQRRVDIVDRIVYSSFAQFAARELRLGKSQAYALLDVARNYTAQDVDDFGTTRLLVLLHAPPAKKEAVRTLMVEGASLRKMRRELSDRSDSSLQAETERLRSETGLVVVRGGAADAAAPPPMEQRPTEDEAPPDASGDNVRSLDDARRSAAREAQAGEARARHEAEQAAIAATEQEAGVERHWSDDGEDWSQAVLRLARAAPVALLDRLEERHSVVVRKPARDRVVQALAELAKLILTAQQTLIREGSSS